MHAGVSAWGSGVEGGACFGVVSLMACLGIRRGLTAPGDPAPHSCKALQAVVQAAGPGGFEAGLAGTQSGLGKLESLPSNLHAQQCVCLGMRTSVDIQ